MAIRLTVLGASGKMGKRIFELADRDPEITVVHAYTRKQGDLLKSLSECDVAIDFTAPETLRDHLQAALNAGKALVIGTTGLSADEKRAIEEASQIIPILYSPNFSFGMALCLDAAARFAEALGSMGTIEIVETHHVHKKDAPSGTAIALAGAVGVDSSSVRSVRQGEVIGEHTVIFKGEGEKIELRHVALSRDVFAAGALRAAKFLAGRGPRLYTLKDLLVF